MQVSFLTALVTGVLFSTAVAAASEPGALALDHAFHDGAGRPGFDTGSRTWPHGWTGPAVVHGIVFSK
jgi:hypothetical protein